MVKKPADWKWSSYRASMGLEPYPFWLSADGLLALFAKRRNLAQQRYVQFVLEGINEASPWSNLKGQVFLGDEQFVHHMQAHIQLGKNGQRLLDFARPDNVILTNLGVNAAVLASASVDEQIHWTQPETRIASHHRRGADELPHRGLKDFGFEALPFKRFPAHAAFYSCMLIAFFLSETFKEDVLVEVLPVTSYATTVRRRVIDIAAKVVRTGGQVMLKVTHSVMTTLRFARLWARCQSPPPILAV